MKIPFFPKFKWRGTGGTRRSLLALMLATAVAGTMAAESRQIEFSIPQQRADRALRAFAQQAGISVLFPYDEVSRTTANRLVGTHDVNEALDLLLANTGLTATIRDGNRLIVSVEEAPARSVSARVAESGPQGPDNNAPQGLIAKSLATFASTLKAGTAASDAPSENPGVARLEEITITGSRIHQHDFNSAQPTTVLDSEMLALLGLNNTGDAMTLVPANLGNWNPTAKPGGNESFPLNVFNGLNLANLRGLNPRYGSRTLTLVNSRRHMPTNQGDGVDLNLIPSILIDRMEIVTGGASASYGSGAIAGVVNVLLDDELDGSRAEVGFATTAQHDGHDRYYGFAWGGDVNEDGHLTLGLELQNMDPIEDCIETRDWCARGASLRENRLYQANAEPNFVYRENVRFDMSKSGVFSALGREFNAAGDAVVPYQTPGQFQVGGDGQHIYLDTSLRTNVERKIAYAAYDHRLGPDRHFYLESSFGAVDSWTPQDGIDLFAARINPDNFFLNRLAENPCGQNPASCFLNKDFSAQVESVNDTRTELGRITVGFGDRIGDTSWTWDAYYQYGQADMLEAVHNSRHALRMMFAMDAVDDGSGHPVCRVIRDGVDPAFDGDARLADGCEPINVFGTKPIASNALNYSFGRILENTRVNQDMVEFVASGDLAAGFGAGPVLAAAGFSWRDETLENVADIDQPDYIRTDYNSQFGETFGGDVKVAEYFTELEIPVTEHFGLQLAGRSSHYQNTAGIGTPVEGREFKYDINTWKINGNWQPLEWLTLRASESRDSRAPNFRELYYGKVFPKGSNFGYCDNPWTGNRFEGFYTFTGDACRAELRGGIDLKPERSDTTTFGFVLAPPGYNARLAVDYFKIEIEDAITPASWSHTIDQCFRKDPEFCALIDGQRLDVNDPLGGFARLDVVSSKSLNQQYYRTEGLDLIADWVFATDAGTFSTRFMATHMIRQLVQPSATSPVLRDIAGVSGSAVGGFDWEAAPDWSAQWFTTFARGPYSLTVQTRYVSEGIKDAARIGPHQAGYDPDAANSIDDNRVPDYVVWGLNTSIDFDIMGFQAQLFASIQNLFDKDPPLIGTGIGGTNAVLFDTVGRRYRIGLRTQF